MPARKTKTEKPPPENAQTENAPLAHRLRPQKPEEIAGQKHLLAANAPLAACLAGAPLHSMILWGPPGCGKTTLAKLLAKQSGAKWVSLSAAGGSAREARAVMEEQAEGGAQTVLFMDEAHRFNKAQQDAFLPHLESGRIVFIGATTENPSFEINSALLSRVAVYPMRPLEEEALAAVLRRAENELQIAVAKTAAQIFINHCGGDARRLLNAFEAAAQNAKEKTIGEDDAKNALGEAAKRFDKRGDRFYEQISALHKSVRGSDPDAALYWLCRMLQGGCDPLYISRRLARMASEDIGLAEPGALAIAQAADRAYRQLGSPEGELALAQAAAYLACAPKSNAVYSAFQKMSRAVKNDRDREVPPHLCNAPTRLMKQIGKGEGYRYAHDEPEAYAAGVNYFPADMKPLRFYQPVDRGLETKIKEKLNRLRALDANHKK